MSRRGYYEHESRVKFTEGLLAQSHDWQWFIDLTEGRFEPPGEIASVEEFQRAFSSLRDPYVYLTRIVDSIGDFKPSFSGSWLEEIYGCVLLGSGLKEPEEFTARSGFYGLLGVASYVTCLCNRLSGFQYLIDNRALYYSNLHQLIDFNMLHDEWPRLERLVESVALSGIEDVRETLKGNFEGINEPVDAEFVNSILDENFDADFLDFKQVDRKTFQTWQEAFLCDAFGTSYMGGDLEPTMRANGVERPNVSGWTEDLVKFAKAAFGDNRAVCVLEVVALAKWGIEPSERTQEILVDLAVEHADRQLAAGEDLHALQCTASVAIESMIEKRLLKQEFLRRYNRGMSGLLANLVDYQDLSYLKEHGLPLSKNQKSLFESKTKTLFRDALGSVASSRDLIAAYQLPHGYKYCDQKDAKRSLDLLFDFLEKGDAGVMVAELFYAAMVFYLDLMGNADVDKAWVKRTVIALRHCWQDTYYSQVTSGMHCFSTGFSVSLEKSDAMNKDFLAAPWAYARSIMLQSEDHIVATLEDMSKHAFVYMFSKTNISEYFPDHVHVTCKDDVRSIDRMIVEEVKRVYEENAYRFINRIPEQELLDGFFDSLSKGLQIGASVIRIPPVYDELVKIAPEHYGLLPNPGDEPLMGHLTQLFPLLENAIREVGEFFDIVPFQADKNAFSKLKDVTGVLEELIVNVRELTGTVQGCNEFLFVHFVMYSHNGFNIRNDCVHGRRYQGPSDVVFAYRLTVMCTYMMLKRLRMLEELALGKDASSAEGPDCQSPAE